MCIFFVNSAAESCDEFISEHGAAIPSLILFMEALPFPPLVSGPRISGHIADGTTSGGGHEREHRVLMRCA